LPARNRRVNGLVAEIKRFPTQKTSVTRTGLWPLILLGGLAGFGVVSLWANFGDTVGRSWNNVVAAIGTPPASNTTRTVAGRASIVDGDTVDIRGVRIRFNGIDAPESSQSCRDRIGSQYPCGRRATLALSDKIDGQNLSCDVLGQDQYGRSLATCNLGTLDLNGWMVSSGWALAYRHYSTAYVGAEEQAQATRVGIWEGAFTPPWEWRRSHDDDVVAQSSHSSASSAASQSGCAIKGNLSSSGERIFHVPGQQYYSRTVISEAKGERWFCSEAEALADGWRASKR
jgi:endonuclease YncB( thermonuclease family)